jgi:hypothetical protein
MDTLTHALYGATCFSRSGLAGGKIGVPGTPRPHFLKDPTCWAAAAFGLLPDLASLGIPFLIGLAQGVEHFFRTVDGQTLAAYHALHNLALPGLVSLLFWFFARRWFVASLSWPLHIAMDAISHGSGKFQTRPFYPFSDWGFPGINWWENTWIVWACWIGLVAMWSGLITLRITARRHPELV